VISFGQPLHRVPSLHLRPKCIVPNDLSKHIDRPFQRVENGDGMGAIIFPISALVLSSNTGFISVI
jgi:hypothetical protein